MTGILTLSNLLAWSLQVALVVLGAFVALALLRVELPALRYGFLRAVLAICLALPFVQTAGPPVASVAAAVTTSSAVAAAGDTMAGSRGPSPTQVFDTYAPPIVAMVIAAGLVARLLWIGAGLLRLRGLRQAGIASGGSAYEDLQQAIGVRPAIRWVPGLGQPVTFGFREPIVLLPSSLGRKPADIQRAVVAHELWHVRRRDWLWTVVEELLRAVFWWHPAIWILLSRIQGAREEVVDRLAIEATGSRRTYVDALLAYAGESPLCGSTAFGRRRHLVHRLVLISKEAVMSARRVVVCGALLGMVTMSSGWLAVQAFPLAQVVGWAGDDPFSEPPGPIELRAKPVTPDNPVPRRIYFVPPHYPAEAAEIGATATATVRVTLDENGHLVQARLTNLSVRSRQPQLNLGIGGPDGYKNLERLLSRSTGLTSLSPTEQQRVQQVFGALAQAAVGVVRQWQYDRPADGPISFAATVRVAPEADHALAAPGVPGASPDAMMTERVVVGPTRERPGFDAPQQDLGPDGALRIGGNIKPPTKLRHVNPVYPPDARDAGVQGVVIIECRIEPDGTVSDAQVLRSIPMLDEAAVGAVEQWEFTPTLMNGVPVPVIMTVTVNFTLQ